MYYASICAIVKDEQYDIMEWLAYHFAIGFEHILLYDNNSHIPLRNTLSKFIESGLVTVFDMPLTEGQQLSAYLHALCEWGSNTYWLAFIDIDEFILPLQKNDVRDLLDDYTDFAGLCGNWNMFSSNGHICRPAGGVLENYTDCLGLNPHIKSIVQPKFTTSAISPHHFMFMDGCYCVNEDKIPVRNFHTYPLANKLCINHYYYKSQQDFFAKMSRGFATRMNTATERNIDIFYEHLQQKGFFSDQILRFQSKMSNFLRFPVTALSDIVQHDMHKGLAQGIPEIESALAAGKTTLASQICKTLRRYHNVPALDIVAANLAFVQGRFEDGLEILRKLMGDPTTDEDDLRNCYTALENYYALSGRDNVKKQISTYIN